LVKPNLRYGGGFEKLPSPWITSVDSSPKNDLKADMDKTFIF